MVLKKLYCSLRAALTRESLYSTISIGQDLVIYGDANTVISAPPGFKSGTVSSMTRDEAIKLLAAGEDGVQHWNDYRKSQREIPKLDGIKLERADLRRVNLSGASLREINLRGADAHSADLSGADLYGAKLTGADLSHANLKNAHLHGATLSAARLNQASLIGANLTESDLAGAILVGCDLSGCILRMANLNRADLTRAILNGADLSGPMGTLPSGEVYRRHGANLVDARLVSEDLNGTKLSGASFGRTVIAFDLSKVVGLDETRHFAPSHVALDSLLALKGELPEAFLRGCGLRQDEIDYFRSQAGKPIRFYSCFISYSTADEAFATRLYNDFQAAGIRCWKWDHDARTGKSLQGEIDHAIRVHDKVVLIASESSLKSPAVNREIERAIVLEDERLKKKRAGEYDGSVDVLFPLRVDDYIFEGWKHERKVDVTKKVIADAVGWEKDDKKYREVRDRLIRDLKPE